MSQHIINVTETNFDYEVIEFSINVPVLVDFWAEWCVPCKTLTPILSNLADQGQGDFRLARLNVDENQKIAMRFNVRGIPAVKAFRDGVIIGEFSGLKPEDEVRSFLQRILPSHVDLSMDKGHSLLNMERWEDAASAFQTVLDERPDHPRALIGLAKSLIILGQIDDAIEILDAIPPGQDYSKVKRIRPLSIALKRLDQPDIDEPTAIEATYQRALKLINMGNIPAAMDGILAVLRQEKHYRDDETRQVILGLFEILGEKNPITRQYSKELASILF
jgi:putative thioredoxin